MELLKYSALKCFGSWRSCSHDIESGICMVEDDTRIIDYDQVKTAYLNALGKSEECAASVDALGQDNEGHLYMIEFKNGTIDNREIRNKIIESIMIFCDITSCTIEDTRKNMDFILVYNPNESHFHPLDLKAIELARLGKAPCPFHGLKNFDKFCVQKAYMMTAESFKKRLVGLLHT